MKISEIREWAAKEYGSHSHKEGQVLAALGPIEEWLGHLARQGVMFELVPTELWAKYNPSPPLKEEDLVLEEVTVLNAPQTEAEVEADRAEYEAGPPPDYPPPPMEHFVATPTPMPLEASASIPDYPQPPVPVPPETSAPSQPGTVREKVK